MIHTARLALIASASMASFISAAPAWAEEAGEAPAIIVYGRPDGYDIEKTPTATKTQTPLVDVPQAVSVISREQLDDQGVESLGAALRFVPGVVLGQGEGHRDQVTLRGQNSTADFFVDGLRDDAQYYRPLYNVERVEVLKGANALIFGRGGGGGVINRVSKAPEFGRTRAAVSGGVDTFGALSLATDLGAPISDSIGSRLNATYERFDNHRQHYDGHFLGVTPTLGARLGEATTLTATYEYIEDRRLTDRGVPSRGGLPLTGFDKTLFGSADLNRSEVDAHLIHARIDHEFSGSLSANFSAQFASYDKYYANMYPRAAVTPASTVEFEGYANSTERQNWIAQGNLIWTGETGTIGHTLLLGFEAADQDTRDLRLLAIFQASPFGPTSTRVSVPLASPIVLPATSFTTLSRSTTSQVKARSGYIQDQVEIGEHVKLVAGLRFDDFRISAVNLINLGRRTSRSDSKWSPRLGLILKPQENLSVYASYAISFLPQSGDQFTSLDVTQATLAPEKFENLEAGVKWNVSDALAFTFAAYRLDRTNSRFNDPVTGNVQLSGKTRAKGIEAALVGQLGRNLQVSLGYALQNGEVRTPSVAAPQAGNRLAQLPRHQASAWARYNVSESFGIGLGLLHQSGQYATISNFVRLPAFTRLDAALFYDISDQVTLQLNVENLTDAGYFPSAHTDNNISVGEPINAKATLRVKF